jgi:hypothetical protein
MKTFKTKSFEIWFFFHYGVQVRSEVVDGNLLPIWEYSSTVKNHQKWASHHHRMGVKELNMKCMYMKYEKYGTVHVFMTKTDHFLTVYSLYH